MPRRLPRAQGGRHTGASFLPCMVQSRDFLVKVASSFFKIAKIPILAKKTLSRRKKRMQIYSDIIGSSRMILLYPGQAHVLHDAKNIRQQEEPHQSTATVKSH